MLRKMVYGLLFILPGLVSAMTIPGESAYCLANCNDAHPYCTPLMANLGQLNFPMGAAMAVCGQNPQGQNVCGPVSEGSYNWGPLGNPFGTPSNISSMLSYHNDSWIFPQVTYQDSGWYSQEGSNAYGSAFFQWCLTVNIAAILNPLLLR